MTRTFCCLLAVLVVAAQLAGCGNKGALVLPDQQPAKKHKTSEPAPASKPADTPAQGSGTSGGSR